MVEADILVPCDASCIIFDRCSQTLALSLWG